MKANESKSIHVTFPTRRETCPPPPSGQYKQCVTPARNSQGSWATPWQETYLSQTNFRKMLTRNHPHQLGLKSKLSTSNKFLIYKTILKPIWTYGIQLWGTASTSNLEILERFQSKALRMIVDAPWYEPNMAIRRDLQIQTAATALNVCSPQRTSKWPNSKPHYCHYFLQCCV
jgi:hypothetical protein